MQPEAQTPPHAAAAVEAGLGFLARSQLPSGQFATYVGPDLLADPLFEASPFTTALVAHSLGKSTSRVAEEIIDRAVEFLASEMLRGGAWRYWSSNHATPDLMLPDLDDTACISDVLSRRGRPVSNRRLFLANRDRRRRFYTWIFPRFTPPPLNLDFWRLARENRDASLLEINGLSTSDISGVVNANILAYLGDGPWAAPVVEYLLDIVRRRAETIADTWYYTEFPFYYSIARCIERGISGLAHVGDEIAARIEAAQGADGRIGPGVLETAIAISALHSLGARSVAVERGCKFILDTQGGDGSWEIAPMYHGGVLRPGAMLYGSPELTTGFCVQALLPFANEQ
jgi:hypothetical protein